MLKVMKKRWQVNGFVSDHGQHTHHTSTGSHSLNDFSQWKNRYK